MTQHLIIWAGGKSEISLLNHTALAGSAKHDQASELRDTLQLKLDREEETLLRKGVLLSAWAQRAILTWRRTTLIAGFSNWHRLHSESLSLKHNKWPTEHFFFKTREDIHLLLKTIAHSEMITPAATVWSARLLKHPHKHCTCWWSDFRENPLSWAGNDGKDYQVSVGTPREKAKRPCFWRSWGFTGTLTYSCDCTAGNELRGGAQAGLLSGKFSFISPRSRAN